MQEEIHVWFPMVKNNFNLLENSFTINEMRCRTVCVVYFIVHCYNEAGTEILVNNKPVHISERWAVDETWSSYTENFDFDEDYFHNINEARIELILINVDDDNPLDFTECMLSNIPFTDYHDADETITYAEIGFNNNTYANLYSNNQEGDYLQVIRPYKTSFTNQTLTKSKCTVLAPHIVGEADTDKPQNLFFEFVNQTEQEINIKPV